MAGFQDSCFDIHDQSLDSSRIWLKFLARSFMKFSLVCEALGMWRKHHLGKGFDLIRWFVQHSILFCLFFCWMKIVQEIQHGVLLSIFKSVLKLKSGIFNYKVIFYTGRKTIVNFPHPMPAKDFALHLMVWTHSCIEDPMSMSLPVAEVFRIVEWILL